MKIGYRLEPRYTPGSPALVFDAALAQQVAAEERRGYEQALSGVWGEEERARAERLGVALVVFSMRERARGWEVADLITGEEAFWPFRAACPTCGARSVDCDRGVLRAHAWKGSHVECSNKSYVGVNK